MELIFHSHANKTLFHKKVVHSASFWKWGVFGTRKWPIHQNAKHRPTIVVYCAFVFDTAMFSNERHSSSVPNLFLLFLKPWSAWDWGLEFTIFIFSTWFICLIVRKHCFQFFPGITVVSREIEGGGGEGKREEGKRGLLWEMWKWWILSSVVNSSIVASASRKNGATNNRWLYRRC